MMRVACWSFIIFGTIAFWAIAAFLSLPLFIAKMADAASQVLMLGGAQ